MSVFPVRRVPGGAIVFRSAERPEDFFEVCSVLRIPRGGFRCDESRAADLLQQRTEAMNTRVLKRVYTAKQLNRGVGMVYHPVTGERLRRLTYHRSRGAFARVYEFPLADSIVEFRRQISERQKYYAYGSCYPRHWRFDPWTGEKVW